MYLNSYKKLTDGKGGDLIKSKTENYGRPPEADNFPLLNKGKKLDGHKNLKSITT